MSNNSEVISILGSIDESLKQLVLIANMKRSTRAPEAKAGRSYYSDPADPCAKCSRKEQCRSKRCFERDEWLAQQ